MKKAHIKIHNIINAWFYDLFTYGTERARYDISCSFEVYGRNIYIYSNKPGILIGCHGKNVYRLEDLLKEQGIHKRVNFIETPSGYVREIRVKRKWF